MSGGVDSSVAAALLQRQGYDVIGATMKLWRDTSTGPADTERSCCTLSAVEDARRVAQKLGIPHYVFNFQAAFAHDVIDYFTAEYTAGRTPNPCIACNRHLKFGALLQKASELEADFVATGHYAQIDSDGQNGKYRLLKGLDERKDQSYVLYHLDQYSLAHFLLPLGCLTKPETRKLASEFGFAVANKPESQEICFIPDNDYRRFLQDRAPGLIKPGPYVAKDGTVLGMHKGFSCYTIGQRKGLGIALGQPMFVTAIDPLTNRVTLGLESDVFSDYLSARDVNWLSGCTPSEPFQAMAKIRSTAAEQPATVIPLPGQRLEIQFAQKQRAITPGQSVVLYDGDSRRYEDTKRLFEYGFTQIESITPESLYAEDPRVIDVTGFDTSDAQHGELTLGIRAVDEDKDMTIVGRKDNIDFLRENFGQVSSIRWTREFRAPINVGDVMGILTFYSENKGVAEYELVATRSIAARADAPLTLEQIEAYTAQDESPWPRFSWDLLVPPGLILLALIWLMRFIRRHRKKRIKAPKIKPIKKKYLR